MVFYDEQRPFLWAISIVNTKKLASKNLSYNWIVHKNKKLKKLKKKIKKKKKKKRYSITISFKLTKLFFLYSKCLWGVGGKGQGSNL